MKTLFVALLLFLASCSKPDAPSKTNRPNVLATIEPYGTLTEMIVQGEAEITTLLPKGADLHTFEPTPRSVEHLTNIDVWIQVGVPLEKRIEPIICAHSPNLRIVNLSEKIPLLPLADHHCGDHDHDLGARDIHMWLGPKELPSQVRAIAEPLIQTATIHQKTYLDGMNTLIQQIEELDRSLTISLNPFAGRSLLVSHPSLGYYCHDYLLQQIPIECEGKELGPKDLSLLLETAKGANPLCVITQTGFDTRGARLIADHLNLPLIHFDPFATDYFANMRRLTDNIVSSGSKESDETPSL